MFKKRKTETAAIIELKDKKRGERWTLTLPPLSESRENPVNPWRGWYQIYSFKAEERPDFEELKWCLRAEESLVLIRIDIGAFAERDLSEALDNMADILSFFAGVGKGILLRVVYDTAGRGIKKEPKRFERVKGHLIELKPLIARFSEDILVYQGLLVGSWGEMHDSAYLSQKHLRELMQILLSIEGKNCYFAVRTPAQWRNLVGEGDWQEAIAAQTGQAAQKNGKKGGSRGEAVKYIGLFDDGMFASENHLGTFGEKIEAEALWEEPWRRKDELMFESRICRFTPNGGEAVASSQANPALRMGGMMPLETFAGGVDANLPEFEKVLKQMSLMHITYLNSAYDKRILDAWQKETWKSKDVWDGMNGYDYIGCRLGYRFVVRKAAVCAEKKRERGFGGELDLEMENIGFGAFPRMKKSRLILEIEQEGEIVWKECFSTEEYPLPCGGEKVKISLPFALLPGNLYFRLEALVKDRTDTVYFGNEGCTKRGLQIAQIRKS